MGGTTTNSNNNQTNNMIDFASLGGSSTNQNNNNNLFDGGANNSKSNQSTGFDFLGGFTNNNSMSTSSSNMKEIHKNNEITIYCSSSKADNTTNATLAVSNNTDKQISNVKITLMVIKYVQYKVLSTSGAVLEPRQTYGIKKVNDIVYF